MIKKYDNVFWAEDVFVLNVVILNNHRFPIVFNSCGHESVQLSKFSNNV